jgi:hypothetical protein
MTDREFKANARKFVIDTIRDTFGKRPPKAVIERTTAKLLDNFRSVTSNQEKRGNR